MSADMIEEFRDAFELFDKDGDGFVTAVELGTVMRSLGLEPTDEELDDLVREIDEDGNGTIELEEFVKIMNRRAATEEDREKELHESFQIFDRDNDGLISPYDIQFVLMNLGEKLSDEEAGEIIREADKDGDGQVNFAEFMYLMRGT
ncbi:Calmodulin [Aphelenchoides avenae]|nr:Calmodulin [Aphelenchus avenae]